MSRAKLIIVVFIAALIVAVYYSYSFYHENIEVFSINKSVKTDDIKVCIDEVLLVPRFLLGEPFQRELTVRGTVTDISTDGRYTQHLSELVKVYVKDGPGMGFGQDAQVNYYYFWTYRIYDGNESIDLIIANSISKQKIPLTIDLRNYNSRWINKRELKTKV